MGCCQSRAIEEHDYRNPSESPPLSDVCYPDKIGNGGLKVLTSSASTSSASSSSYTSGRTYTRLVAGPDWLFAALFEALGGTDRHGPGSRRDAAARFCAENSYAEYQHALEGAGQTASGSSDDKMRNILVKTLKALDRRFLTNDGISAEDRYASGCTGVLLHVFLGDRPLATAASIGPCAAVLGQRRGGLASATSAPVLLCGGTASSHDGLQGFLAALTAELPVVFAAKPTGAVSKKGSGSSKATRRASKDISQQFSTPATLPGGEPGYSYDLSAPSALGFGCGKGMQLLPAGRSASEQPREACIGLGVQTATHALGPSDDCVVLLSGGATASIAPADVALLMHRMGRLASIPYETKEGPLPLDVPCGPEVQLDSLGIAGPQAAAAPAAAAAAAIAPFNAARLLVKQGEANVQARGRSVSGGHIGAMAFALEWPRTSDDAAAAVGASVSAVCTAAAAAVRNRQRAQYRWQLLRLYYKVPHKRRAVIISRWHEIFDRVVGEGKRTANLKETAAWLRLGAAVKVSAAGNVHCLSSRKNAPEHPAQTPPRRVSPAPRQSHTSGGIPTSPSPMHSFGGIPAQSRLPLSSAGTINAQASGGVPMRTASKSLIAPRSPSLGSTSMRQRSSSFTPAAPGAPSRSSSNQDPINPACVAATTAFVTTAGPLVADSSVMCSDQFRSALSGGLSATPSQQGPLSLLAATPSQNGPIGLLDVALSQRGSVGLLAMGPSQNSPIDFLGAAPSQNGSLGLLALVPSAKDGSLGLLGPALSVKDGSLGLLGPALSAKNTSTDLLEADGINLQHISEQRSRLQEAATDGGCDIALIPSLKPPPQKSVEEGSDDGPLVAVAMASSSTTKPAATSIRAAPVSSVGLVPAEGGSGQPSAVPLKDPQDGASRRGSRKISSNAIAPEGYPVENPWDGDAAAMQNRNPPATEVEEAAATPFKEAAATPFDEATATEDEEANVPNVPEVEAAFNKAKLCVETCTCPSASQLYLGRKGETEIEAADAAVSVTTISARPTPIAVSPPPAHAPAAIHTPTTARTKIPSPNLSSGGASSPPSSSSIRKSPRSRIPTLSLTPGPVGVATISHATPRLSMPGSTPKHQPKLATGARYTATVKTTPRIRDTSKTWGGAGPSLTRTYTPPSTAPNSARSGSSRLPRPPTSASPAGSVSNRSLFGGSDTGSVRRSTSSRPPRLVVMAAATADTSAGATSPREGEDLDLLSPDADQLAAWAMEAVDAIGASGKKPSHQQEQPQSSTPTTARSNSGRVAFSNTPSAFRISGGGASTSSGGSVRPRMGSRIPLSPRDDDVTTNTISISSNTSGKLLACTRSQGSVGKPLRTASSNSSIGGTTTEHLIPNATSTRSRR